MAARFRFLRDPAGVELVHHPRVLLDRLRKEGYVQGDCDDAAILGAALGKVIGLPARFVVVGFRGPRGPLTHVYAEVSDGSRWVDLDVTAPAQGFVVPPTRRVIEKV